jgi:solute carrier family 35 protein C2
MVRPRSIISPPLTSKRMSQYRFTLALLLSLYNKWMFAPEHFGFPLPLFVTMLHMFVQATLASLLRFGWPRRFRPEYDPSKEDYL